MEPVLNADFFNLPKEEQRAAVVDYRQLQSGKRPISVIVKASTLAGLFIPRDSASEDEVMSSRIARTAWREEILANKANAVIIIRDNDEAYTSILEFTMESKAPIQRVPKAEIAHLVERERIKKGADTLIGVMDADFQSTDKTLVVTPHPVSFLLIRPLLEYGDRKIPANDPEVLAIVQQYIAEIYSKLGLLRSA